MPSGRRAGMRWNKAKLRRRLKLLKFTKQFFPVIRFTDEEPLLNGSLAFAVCNYGVSNDPNMTMCLDSIEVSTHQQETRFLTPKWLHYIWFCCVLLNLNIQPIYGHQHTYTSVFVGFHCKPLKTLELLRGFAHLLTLITTKPNLQAECRQFESDRLHHRKALLCKEKSSLLLFW